MFRILIAEDEEPIANLIRMNLTKAGYLCTWAPDGKSAADLMEREKYDLALLDIMLPGINGYELMDYAKACELPVIFLTALGSTEHKVKGLRMGADDYLPKPFEIVELLARVEAVLRRYHKTETVIRACNVTIDTASHRVTLDGEEIYLTPKEFDLLLLFARNKKQGVVSGNHIRDCMGWRIYGTEPDRGSACAAAEEKVTLGKYYYSGI